MLEEMLEQFPVVVVPEQTRMSDKMVKLLKAYVKEGGCLLLTGVGMAERFGYDYLGVQKKETVDKATYYLPVGKKEMFPLYSGTWGLVTTAKASRAFGRLSNSPLRNEKLTDYPVAVFKRHGYGTVAFMPADICRDYQSNRYPETRKFSRWSSTRRSGWISWRVAATTACCSISSTARPAIRRGPARGWWRRFRRSAP